MNELSERTVREINKAADKVQRLYEIAQGKLDAATWGREQMGEFHPHRDDEIRKEIERL